MEPPPEEAPPGAYGGSRLPSGLEAPDAHALAGRGEVVTAEPVGDSGSRDGHILTAIADQEAWMAELLGQLVRAPTTLGNEEPGQVVVEGALREMGLEPVDVPMDAGRLRAHPMAAPFDWEVDGKRNVVATWSPPVGGTVGRSLILNGHIDVVSPEPRSQWGMRDPFFPRRDDGWMIGRGAADMKCGLAAILGAVRGLRSMGLSPGAPITIESVVEEECTGNGTLQTLLDGYTADAAVIAEPFGAAITTSQVGVLWFSVRITGVPGHAAEGQHATNAIEGSLAVIGALRSLEADLNAVPPPPYDLFTHPINLNVGTIRGGDWPSTVPGECETGYRIALYPDMSIQDLKTRIETAVDEATVDRPGSTEVRYNGFSSRGYDIADDHPLVESLAHAFTVRSGTPPALVATTGTTDAAVFGNVADIPAVCFGPYAEAAHGVGERVYLPSVVQTAQVLGLFVRDWCGLT
ncbi:MAG TPA: ArgE/DapE family deacylase [Actinomycetota bacterium]|nr:ArgE/DapE family deacylase [Actinomycetota bacterium]